MCCPGHTSPGYTEDEKSVEYMGPRCKWGTNVISTYNIRCFDSKIEAPGGAASCHQSRHCREGMTMAKHSYERGYPKHIALLALLFISMER
jgi:hypothetical protein